MKIQIVGSNKLCKTKIDEIIKDLPLDTTVEELEFGKFNIKYPPAIKLDNVLVEDINKLSTNELKYVILQFFET